MKEKIIFIFYIIFSINVLAAQTNILTLKQCIDLAVKNNYTVQEGVLNLQNTYLDLDISRNSYYPKLTLEAAAPKFTRYHDYYSRTEKNPLQDYYFYNRWDNTLEANLTTEIPTGADLNVGLRGVQNLIDSEHPQYQPDSRNLDYFFSTELKQPIFRRNITAIDISKKKEKLKNQQLDYNQTIKNIKYDITASYYNLLKAIKDHKINMNVYNASKLNYELGEKKFKTGLIPEVDALQLEVSYNQKQASVLKSKNQIDKSREILLFNMGLPLEYPMDIVRDISYESRRINFNKTLEITSEKDVIINGLKYKIYESEQDYKAIKDDSNLNAYISLFYDHSINQEPSPYYHEYDFGGSLSLIYPLIDFGLSRKKMEKIKNQIEFNRIELKKQKVVLERGLSDLVRDIEENRKKITIYSNAVAVAQKRYDINMKQFQEGIITTLELLTSESDLNDSERSYLDTIISYILKISQLETDYHVVYEE